MSIGNSVVNFQVGFPGRSLLNMDINYDQDSDENETENGVDLTGFLFGNIDSDGRLVDDIFDSESTKQLGSLGR